MAVPYGDPNFPYIRKCAFDVVGDSLEALRRPSQLCCSVILVPGWCCRVVVACCSIAHVPDSDHPSVCLLNEWQALSIVLYRATTAWASLLTAWSWDAIVWATSSTLME
eukprot:GHUV01047474.1.p1 GENE.GHUV01047474.1~~GHUV01047474.1.p1  ORF type:complete len:109 (-),score=5.07 GHUV01047474.1:280-606(-)